jgi:IS5 family transposase
VLPAEVRELLAELAKVDAILDDERFLAPFRRRLTATTRRPTIPIETYLRLMFLKYRYGLGYETLCREVADSLTWRRFRRLALDARVPDPTTLIGPDPIRWTRSGYAAWSWWWSVLLAVGVIAAVPPTMS